jgi:hypothetical protein
MPGEAGTALGFFVPWKGRGFWVETPDGSLKIQLCDKLEPLEVHLRQLGWSFEI